MTRGPELGEWSAQVRRGVLELCILSHIARGPAYGYDLVTRLASVPQLAVREGTLYPLLRRLREDGRLETTWQESDAGPPRQYYRLTPGGRQYLKAIRQEWSALVAGLDRFLGEEEPSS